MTAKKSTAKKSTTAKGSAAAERIKARPKPERRRELVPAVVGADAAEQRFAERFEAVHEDAGA